MSIDLSTLPWLPRPPDDFRKRCRALVGSNGAELRALANYAHDSDGLISLARWAKEIADPRPLRSLAVALLGNGTMDFLVPALIATAPRHGVHCSVTTPLYGTSVQLAFDAPSMLDGAKPDVVVLAFDHRGLPMEDGAKAALDLVFAMRDAIVAATGATVIFQTIAQTPQTTFGSLDAQVAETLRARIDAFNRGLAERAVGQSPILDVAAISATVGLQRWHDPVRWNLAKLPFAQDIVPLYADHLARLLAALTGRVRKCIVFDLDNTLWGGVIGDDGLEGIRIAEGDASGEAFRAIQRMGARLRQRGVVLAVCSKNEEDAARLPFRDHPDMLLREDDFACFMANWTDKATNLEAIAEAIGIGIDALVFVDDNPAERELVRSMLPDVAVPELPEDPAFYPLMVESAGYFESLAFTDEDKIRADQYQGNARRAELKAKSRDLGDYLRSMEMVLKVRPFDAMGRARIGQLINKSNQFNLTTRRYADTALMALESDARAFTIQAQLIDRFGDNGMIGTIICRDEGDGMGWAIDSWVMSCRVLGRGVEKAMLNEVVAAARSAGRRQLDGAFIPTGRNELVRKHYANLGFALVETGADGAELWRLSLSEFTPYAVEIAVERS